VIRDYVDEEPVCECCEEQAAAEELDEESVELCPMCGNPIEEDDVYCEWCAEEDELENELEEESIED
jgi:hypothetical protein